MGLFRLSLSLTLLVSVQRAAADPMMLLSECVVDPIPARECRCHRKGVRLGDEASTRV